IKADALEVGCPVVAMTIQNYPDVPHAMRRLKAAHDAGIPTLLLTRHAISPEWWMILDGAKGTSGMVGTVPAGKVRLGASSASATKYGCSVMPSTARVATAKVLKLGGELPPDMTPEVPVVTSQNGYIANDMSRTKVWTVPGTTRTVRLRTGAPGEILTVWAAWF